MPRSINWFEQHSIEGHALTPIAAPAHFGAPEKSSSWKIETHALLKTERAWYELLGRAWAAIKAT
jgi:uncharacterized SAM-binding protein YcdF (DUF218 family)